MYGIADLLKSKMTPYVLLLSVLLLAAFSVTVAAGANATESSAAMAVASPSDVASVAQEINAAVDPFESGRPNVDGPRDFVHFGCPPRATL